MVQVGSAETSDGVVTWTAGLLLGPEAVVTTRNPLWDGECAVLLDERYQESHVWVTGPSARGRVDSAAPLVLTPRSGGDALVIAPRQTNLGTLWTAIFRERDGALYEVPGLLDEPWRRSIPPAGTYDVSLGPPHRISGKGAVRLRERPAEAVVPEQTHAGDPLALEWKAASRGTRIIVSVVPRARTGHGVQCVVPDSGGFTLAERWTRVIDPGEADVILSRSSWSYLPDGAGWIEVVSTMSTSRAVQILRPRNPPVEERTARVARRPAGGRGFGSATRGGSGARDGSESRGSHSAADGGLVGTVTVTSLAEEVVDRSEDEGGDPVTRRVRLGFGSDGVQFVALGSPEECLLFGDDSPLRGTLRADEDGWTALRDDFGLIDARNGGLLAPLPEDRGPRYNSSLPGPGGKGFELHVPRAKYDLGPAPRPGPATHVRLEGGDELIRGREARIRFDRPADGAAQAVVLVGFDDQMRPWSVSCPADRPIPARWTAMVASPWVEVWVLRWRHAVVDGPDGPARLGLTTAQRTRISMYVVGPEDP
jgi:hypothetical protein